MRRTPNGRGLIGTVALGLACAVLPLAAAGAAQAGVTDGVADPADLSRLSLEELTDLEITSIFTR